MEKRTATFPLWISPGGGCITHAVQWLTPTLGHPPGMTTELTSIQTQEAYGLLLAYWLWSNGTNPGPFLSLSLSCCWSQSVGTEHPLGALGSLYTMPCSYSNSILCSCLPHLIQHLKLRHDMHKTHPVSYHPSKPPVV